MAFDGITVAALVNELNTVLDMPDTRIYKIAQPENDELLLTLKTSKRSEKTSYICKCITSSYVSDPAE